MLSYELNHSISTAAFFIVFKDNNVGSTVFMPGLV